MNLCEPWSRRLWRRYLACDAALNRDYGPRWSPSSPIASMASLLISAMPAYTAGSRALSYECAGRLLLPVTRDFLERVALETESVTQQACFKWGEVTPLLVPRLDVRGDVPNVGSVWCTEWPTNLIAGCFYNNLYLGAWGCHRSISKRPHLPQIRGMVSGGTVPTKLVDPNAPFRPSSLSPFPTMRPMTIIHGNLSLQRQIATAGFVFDLPRQPRPFTCGGGGGGNHT